MTVVKGNDIPDLNSALAKILRVVIIICFGGIVYVVVLCLILMFVIVIVCVCLYGKILYQCLDYICRERGCIVCNCWCDVLCMICCCDCRESLDSSEGSSIAVV